MPLPTIIHADLDAFFASVEQKLDPSLIGKPVIVTNTDPQGRLCNKGIVSTASYEARKFGVHSGMSVWEARKLCPNGYYVQGKYEEYEKHSRVFFAVLNDFSPYLSPISLDEGFLDLYGCELLYPDFAHACQKIKNKIKKEVGLTCSLGLAKTRIVAKVASDFNKPDGITIVPIGTEKNFLAPLPIRDLPGVGAKAEIWLKQSLGKTDPKIGDLANLSQNWVEKNLGKNGLNLWQAANGKDSLWFQNRDEPQKSIGRSLTFSNASSNQEYLLAQLRLLTEEVASELFQNNLTTTCVSICIRTQGFENKSRQKVCQPIWQSGEIFSLAKKLFLEVYRSSTLLRLIGIQTTHLLPKCGQLFCEDEKKTKLAQGLAKTRDKYGFDSLLPASKLLIPNKFTP